jgi:hypothetical protein
MAPDFFLGGGGGGRVDKVTAWRGNFAPKKWLGEGGIPPTGGYPPLVLLLAKAVSVLGFPWNSDHPRGGGNRFHGDVMRLPIYAPPQGNMLHIPAHCPRYLHMLYSYIEPMCSLYIFQNEIRWHQAFQLTGSRNIPTPVLRQMMKITIGNGYSPFTE